MDDPIINVGIKQSQKGAIVGIMNRTGNKYKSINEFVQNAISLFIEIEEKKYKEPSKDSAEAILKELNNFNLTLVKEEILGFHNLNNDIISTITKLKVLIENYRSYNDNLTNLLTFRSIKGVLNSYISYLEDVNKLQNLGISEYRIGELKNLKERFVSFIGAQEVKG